MTTTIANALYGYFELLYEFNKKLILLCGLDVQDNSGQYERPLGDIIQAIPRLIPYGSRKGKSSYVIYACDGLMEYSLDLPFLGEDYHDILTHNYSLLEKVKRIRNKYEHKLHGANLVSGGSIDNAVAFDVAYQIDGELVEITAPELISLAKELNRLYSKIQNEVKIYAFETGKEQHAYYRRILRYDFCCFNEIYESNLLITIGKAMYPF